MNLCFDLGFSCSCSLVVVAAAVVFVLVVVVVAISVDAVDVVVWRPDNHDSRKSNTIAATRICHYCNSVNDVSNNVDSAA